LAKEWHAPKICKMCAAVWIEVGHTTRAVLICRFHWAPDCSLFTVLGSFYESKYNYFKV
jgi:hypothetical protein